MVILGGLEVVAAGILIHQHAKNKKEKQRLEEEEYRREQKRYHSGQRRHRSRSRHRSHSRGRDGSRRRRHSLDGRYKYDNPPSPPRPILKPSTPAVPVPPPAYNSAPGASAYPQPQTAPYPEDMKYGWTDGPAAAARPASVPQQPQWPAQDPHDPPTGWPSNWAQTHTPAPENQYLHPQQAGRRDAAGRSGRGSSEPRVRFSDERRGRSPSRTPPPSYRS